MIETPSVEAVDAAVQANDECEIEKVRHAQAKRDMFIANLRELSVYTVELPEVAASQAYDRIADAERMVAPTLCREDYQKGTARFVNEVKVLSGDDELLLSADHATDPLRHNAVHAGADHGTAGLVGVLHEDSHSTAIIPLGRQMGDANADSHHPLKASLSRHIDGKRGFLSVHGMMPGKFTHQYDEAEVHGVIGLGAAYDENTYDIASDAIKRIRDETGLRMVIGNSSRLYSPSTLPRLVRDEDGNLSYSQLAALKAGTTTTNYVRSISPTISAMQVELSRSIRFLPEGMEYRDSKAARIGAYMGLLVIQRICETMNTHE